MGEWIAWLKFSVEIKDMGGWIKYIFEYMDGKGYRSGFDIQDNSDWSS